MNRDAALGLAIAALSLTAVGVSASTLDSTVTTDASDVIDPEYGLLPIGQEEGSAIASEMRRADESESTDASETSPAADGQTESRASASASADGDPVERERQTSPQQTSAQQTSQPAATGDAPAEPTLLDRLRALLDDLFPALLLVAVPLAVAGLLARYRERLFGGEDPEDQGIPGHGSLPTAGNPTDRDPENEVERTWAAMIRRLDLDRPENMTPRECAHAAVDTGLDPDAIGSLTEAFREVRYGGRPITERRQRVVRRLRRRLDGGGDA